MNILFLLRGIPGSGKSSFIPNKYKSLVIEPDNLRLLFSGIKYNKNGKQYINQEKDRKIWKMVHEILEERMKMGSTVIIDATHVNSKNINQYKELINKYNYETYIIDFSHIDLKTALENNIKRPEHKQVPEEVIKTMYNNIINNDIPKWVNGIYSSKEYTFDKILEDIRYKIINKINLDPTKKLNVIGDIHGMYQEFEKLLKNVNIEDEYVVFLGDYFDRFPNSEELVQLFNKLYELSKKENIFFIRGNHEIYNINIKEYTRIVNKIKELEYNLKSLEKEKKEKETLQIDKKVLKLLEINSIEKINSDEILKLFDKKKNELYDLYKKDKLTDEEYKHIIKEIRKLQKKLEFEKNYNKKIRKYKTELENLGNRKKELLKKLDIGRRETLEVLEKEGLLNKFLEFNKNLKNYLVINNNNKKLFFTHGGFVHFFENNDYIFFNEDEFIKGTGTYGDEKEVADNFANMYPNVIQFHGHRDVNFIGPKVNDNVINLNGAAEQGYDLRLARYNLNTNKLENIFQVYTERITRFSNKKEFKENYILEQAKNNKYLKVKQLDNNIYSINFTREAFQNGVWNNMTIHARSLFIENDGKKERTIARGFPKFFNKNEVSNTNEDNIKNWNYPLVVEEKANGFLGIFSVYKNDNKLIPFIASKSTNKSVFAKYFKELLKENLNQKILNFVNEHNISLLFEVIHEKDPHIQEYNKNELVLIGAIKNEINAEPFSYDVLKNIYNKLFKNSKNIRLKEKIAELKNYQEYKNLIEKDKKVPLDKKNYIEGYVIYSKKEGFNQVVKIKTNWYNFWKNMRSLVNKIDKMDYSEFKKQAPNIKKNLINKWKENENSSEIISSFVDYLLKLKRDNIKLHNKSIIELRKDFLENFLPKERENINNKVKLKI